MSTGVEIKAEQLIDTISKRNDLLYHLTEQPMDKRTLDEELEASRSTIDRTIRELETLGLVEYSDGAFRLTTCGKVLVENYRGLDHLVSAVMRLEPFFRWIPPAEFDLDPRSLAEAELFVQEPNNPYAMVDQHVKALERADSFQGVLPLVGLHGVETAHTQVLNHGATHELIIEPGVLETFQSNADFTPLFRDLLQSDRCSIYVSEERIPYFVGVFDDERVQLGVDERGEPRALVESSTETVLEWAAESIDGYRENAMELSTHNLADAPDSSQSLSS